jgi:prepilin-type N-terminal cleavage/methylation domain-containing protein/prepilin-type processing-associated H-X9-DG protein
LKKKRNNNYISSEIRQTDCDDFKFKENKMKKKGFTLIELLVVIAIIAMLLAILMPALNKVKKIAQRVICGTNLKGLGTAQTVYANDYDDEYVVQGRGTAHTWNTLTEGWQKNTKVWTTPGNLTVGASLYLLVREADVSPKSFVCPASGESEFEGKNVDNLDIVDLWDFGSPQGSATVPARGPIMCVSYSYHQPYVATGDSAAKSTRSADGSRNAAFAVMADKNPFFDAKLTNGGTGGAITAQNYMDKAGSIGNDWKDTTTSLERHEIARNNAQPHGRDGQNVLFADGHNSYETRADVGVKNDNIYTRWDTNATATTSDPSAWRKGIITTNRNDFTSSVATSGNDDSVLVNDHIPTLE